MQLKINTKLNVKISKKNGSTKTKLIASKKTLKKEKMAYEKKLKENVIKLIKKISLAKEATGKNSVLWAESHELLKVS